MEAELSFQADGEQHTRADWEAAAAAVLRKSGRLAEDAPDAAVWEAIGGSTLDGVAVAPLGFPELAADVAATGRPGQAPFTRGTTAEPVDASWDVRAAHADPDPERTARAVLEDLENGATSLWLTLGPGGIRTDDLPAVLEAVHLDLAPVVLDAPQDPVGAADAFLALAAGHRVARGTNLGADPLGSDVRDGTNVDAAAAREVVTAVADRASRLGASALVVDGTTLHDAGASDVQELAYTLAAGAGYLRDLTAAGHTVDAALGLLEFRFAATDEQFTTIAKLRAARRLWHRVAELSGAREAARGQVQHAVTSRPMMTRYDPYVNMLRTTVAAFAAGAGGASAVTVLPFDTALGLPDSFSRRIARNTSTLLVAESHAATVTDPAGGAYVVERLTEDLARAAWDVFGRIEEAGGIAAALDDLRDDVAGTAARRAEQLATRHRPVTGVSEYPNLHESLPERRAHPEGAVPVDRYAAGFESLRDDPSPVPVFLATMGTVAAHTARASFVANLLASGGVDSVTAGATEGVEDVLARYDGGPVVCLAGADDAYADWGADLVAALRAAGARRVVLAGRPETVGLQVDDSAAVADDALAFLRRTREQLAEGAGA